MDELMKKRIEAYQTGQSGSVNIYDDPLIRIDIFCNSQWTFDQSQDWEYLPFWVDLYTPAGLSLNVDLTLEAEIDHAHVTDADYRWHGAHSWQNWTVENHNIAMPKMHYFPQLLQVKTEAQQAFQGASLSLQVTNLNVTVNAQNPPPRHGSYTDVFSLVNS